MSLNWNNYTFTGCKAPFFWQVFKDVSYIQDPIKVHLSENSPEVIKNWGFFINQIDWTTHFFQGRKWGNETVMVKLKWMWYYYLFKEYIWNSRWIVTLKCKDIFERANWDEVVDYLIKNEKITTIDPITAKNILWNIKNITSERINWVLTETNKSLFTIEQPWWTTHYIKWKMVKLKAWLLDLLLECINKTKWKISIKCKQVFERWNLVEIKEFIKNAKENNISSDYDLLHN
jgi:hypothetical protein